MHRTKRSRVRILVPSALAVVILSGAAAPAGAADGAGTAALTNRVAAAQEEINDRVAAAGPIDDLINGVTKTLEDLLKSLGILLPGVKLPEIKLPTLPDLPAIPAIPNIPIPEITIPEIPGIPNLPVANPAAPVELAPAVPAIPDIPDIPEIPILGSP